MAAVQKAPLPGELDAPQAQTEGFLSPPTPPRPPIYLNIPKPLFRAGRRPAIHHIYYLLSFIYYLLSILFFTISRTVSVPPSTVNRTVYPANSSP